MKKTEAVLPKFEIIVSSKLCYEIKKVVNARNKYEAVLEMADYLSSDFDFYFYDGDYEVVSVEEVEEE